MKALFIGETGTISTAIVRRLLVDPEFDEWCDKVIAAIDEAKRKIP